MEFERLKERQWAEPDAWSRKPRMIHPDMTGRWSEGLLGQ
jgi:hypothetical protein